MTRRTTIRLALWIVGALILPMAAATIYWQTIGVGRFSEPLELADPDRTLDPAARPWITPDEPDAGPTDTHDPDIDRRDDPSEVMSNTPTYPWPPDPDDLVELDLPDTTRVYLLYSAGSQGVTPTDAENYNIVGYEDRGADGRADVVMLALVDRATRKAALVSIPRDTWMHHRGYRINAVPVHDDLQTFVSDVERTIGIPVHHVAKANFAGFGQVVDAVGGVEVPVARPLYDTHSHLYLPQAGCWDMDGQMALSYVRSRRTQTLASDGNWVSDSTASDFGRMSRQRQFVTLAWDQLRGPRILTEIPTLLSVTRNDITIDQDLGVRELRDLAQTLSGTRGNSVEQYQLPTTGQRFGQAAAQVVAYDPGVELVNYLRTWNPEPNQAAGDRPHVGLATTTLFAAGPDERRITVDDQLCSPDQPRLTWDDITELPPHRR